MAVYNEADFVMQGREVKDPEIAKDELELYYDVKGKKNGDVHKDKLLDMSGQGKDGELSGFDYDGELSGYDGDNGLVFDGIDDKLVRTDVEGIEVISATRNLINGSLMESNRDIGFGSGALTETGVRTVLVDKVKVSPGGEYVLTRPENVQNIGARYYRIDGSYIGGDNLGGKESYNIVMPDDCYYFSFVDESNTAEVGYQLEEGSTATPYVPYIPTAKMTYQLNNNVISYGEGGTVKWVKDGKVMERKGINLFKDSQELKFKGYSNAYMVTDKIYLKKGHKYYVSRDYQKIDGTYNSIVGRITSTIDGELATIIRGEGENYQPSGVYTHAGESGYSHFYVYGPNGVGENGKRLIIFRNVQLIDLTATFGAGNEPTFEEIQAEPDKWQWLPNPMDLVETTELKGNILGDMEDIVDASPRDRQSGKEVFTEHADDSHVEVEVDGQSVGGGSGKNLSTVFRTSAYRTSTYVVVESDNLVALKSLTGNPPTSMLKPKDSAFVRANSGQYTISFEVGDSSVPIRTTILVKDIDGAIITSGVTGHGVYNVSYDGFWREGLDTTRTFTLPQNTHSVAVGLQIPHVGAEGSRENKVFNLQLEEGSIATTYEPPAPTPDYPIEIESVNGFDVVSSVGGRNLLLNSQNFWPNSGEYYTTPTNRSEKYVFFDHWMTENIFGGGLI